ncbi:hypothetical protein HPP92_002105 [Vanilla planifolia]|uniref:Uncharacterized protein n=1 Tax=Vanilla planifolia TaxID=51239 RepID=A0A835S3S0_VANPL|nr:hypothetical protein HPP92_002105 [Vanilla planifolia]
MGSPVVCVVANGKTLPPCDFHQNLVITKCLQLNFRALVQKERVNVHGDCMGRMGCSHGISIHTWLCSATATVYINCCTATCGGRRVRGPADPTTPCCLRAEVASRCGPDMGSAATPIRVGPGQTLLLSHAPVN